IEYIPKNQSPYIYFIKERISLNRLKISKVNYDFRKRDFITRIDSVIHYSTSSSTCRSQLLLSYFGESDSRECGICDVCRNKINSGFTAGEFDMIKEQIK